MKASVHHWLRACITLFVLLASARAQSASPAATFDESLEKQLFQLINQDRQKQDLPLLASDDRLRDTARWHSTFVEKTGQVGYQFQGEPRLQERFAMMNILEDTAGENVSMGTNLEEMHKRLTEAATTRGNVFSPKFTSVGIGVLRRGDHLFVVEDFARRLTEASAPEVEKELIDAVNEVRRQKKIVPLHTLPMIQLRGAACQLGTKGAVNPNAASTQVNNLSLGDLYGNNHASVDVVEGTMTKAVSFTTLHPNEPPEAISAFGHEPQMNAISVGACFVKTKDYPEGVYWVVMVLQRGRTER